MAVTANNPKAFNAVTLLSPSLEGSSVIREPRMCLTAVQRVTENSFQPQSDGALEIFVLDRSSPEPGRNDRPQPLPSSGLPGAAGRRARREADSILPVHQHPATGPVDEACRWSVGHGHRGGVIQFD